MKRLLRTGLALMGIAALILGTLGGGLGSAPALGAAEILVDNACDKLFTKDTLPPGITVIKLDGPAVHECNPTFDLDTGELLSGNGITIDGEDLTLDLNGRSIHSTSNVAAAGGALGLDVENAGVAVGGKKIHVINSSSTVSVVDNFTANFDFKAEDSSLVGSLLGGSTLLGTGVFSIAGGNAHGGGALAIDKSKSLTVDSVKLADMSDDGDNGIDLKRCTGLGVTIKNSHIEGILTGVRVRICQGVTLSNNYISGHNGTGVEVAREVKGALSTISGNVIENNAFNGISIGAKSENISITGNTIRNNGECGIEIAADTKNITVSGNTFANNALGNTC